LFRTAVEKQETLSDLSGGSGNSSRAVLDLDADSSAFKSDNYYNTTTTAATGAATGAGAGAGAGGVGGVISRPFRALYTFSNLLMQLRKLCNHPFLVLEDMQTVPDELYNRYLIQSCGKLAVLDKLLDNLMRTGSKVLIFCQMTTMMDILQGFMQRKGIACARLDGGTSHEQREREVNRFMREYNAEYKNELKSKKAESKKGESKNNNNNNTETHKTNKSSKRKNEDEDDVQSIGSSSSDSSIDRSIDHSFDDRSADSNSDHSFHSVHFKHSKHYSENNNIDQSSDESGSHSDIDSEVEQNNTNNTKDTNNTNNTNNTNTNTDTENEPECSVFLLSTRAGGVGLNLQAADTGKS
jgi:hypothetical protein